MHRFGRCFRHVLREQTCALERTKRFADPSIGGATRLAKLRRDFAKRKQSDAEFAENTTHGYY